MAHYEDPVSYIKDLFDEEIRSKGINNFAKVKVLVNNDMKKIFDTKKASDVTKHLSDFDIIIKINESILDRLDTEQQKMVVVEALTPISHDGERDRIVLNKEDVVTHSGVLDRYDYKTEYRVLQESIKSAYEAKREMERA